MSILDHELFVKMQSKYEDNVSGTKTQLIDNLLLIRRNEAAM